MAKQLILVDTSVWVPFLRGTPSKETKTLDTLLTLPLVATCAPIKAEVISGAPNLREFERMRGLFDAVTLLPLPEDLWQRIEECRFALTRKGYQASLVDLMISLTAQAYHVPLWTLDEDFDRIANVVPINRYKP